MAATYERPLDMGSLRDYVTGQSRMQQAAESTVLLHITHNHLKAKFPEIRLDMHVRATRCHRARREGASCAPAP
jgi:tubulin-folding cofactor B